MTLHRARWQIYRWRPRLRKFTPLGTCIAYHQPEALGKAFRRYGTDQDITVRRWDERFPSSMLTPETQ